MNDKYQPNHRPTDAEGAVELIPRGKPRGSSLYVGSRNTTNCRIWIRHQGENPR